MRKFTFLACLLTGAIAVNAQTIKNHDGDNTVHLYIDEIDESGFAPEYLTHVGVENTTDAAVNVEVNSVQSAEPEGLQIQTCINSPGGIPGACYIHSMLPQVVEHSPGNSTWDLHCLFTNLETDTLTSNITFINANDPEEVVNFIVHWNMSDPTGLGDAAVGTLKSAYPNPANTFATVAYDVKTSFDELKLEVYNLLGSKVKEIALTNSNGVYVLDTESLESGLYIMNLVVDANVVNSGKIVVKH